MGCVSHPRCRTGGNRRFSNARSRALAGLTLPTLSLSVVGADYPNHRGPTRRFEIALCQPGDPVELRPEPKNPADPRAIAVFSERGVQIGYLTAERCGRIGALIAARRPIAAVFQRSTVYGALIRAAFDGESPTLHPEPAAPDPPDDSGFWPDETPPDE